MFRYLILLAIFLTSCEPSSQASNNDEKKIIRRFSNISDLHILKIDFDQNNDNLSVNEMKKISGKVSKLDGLYQIKFNAVLGGGQSNEDGTVSNYSHGDTYKGRLKVTCDSIEHKLSVNEILEWPTKKLGDEKVYVAPRICGK